MNSSNGNSEYDKKWKCHFLIFNTYAKQSLMIIYYMTFHIIRCIELANIYSSWSVFHVLMCISSRELEQSLTVWLKPCLLKVPLKTTLSTLEKTIPNSLYYSCLSNQWYRFMPAKIFSGFFPLLNFIDTSLK